ncbi:rRNA maturation RNase YbeY [Tersicoccus phoenicis]|uniref:Endoribonuclease YbeY n=1 Tax=Tersicoccus phoenicis TaxID=554083 RepID=A0A1R1LES7_9MICC|nr:rRNA maturation RNase YbeY [Tersicoccus phoenicis]OMH26031.1 rRNA maturation RNase YbeY [Tersicoccus phoenicis]
MSIEISNESARTVDEDGILALARHLFDRLHLHPQTELSIVLVDEEAMAGLHRQWMDEPGATDVMSFPMDELRPGTEDAPGAEGLLGDVVVCPQVAARQAERGGHSVDDEVLLLVTHGVLHLLGYDHEQPDEKTEMFALQRTLLSEHLGRPAPREAET